MKRTMFWSHFQSYRKCPQQYLYYKGWPGIDVGAGPGNPYPLSADDLRCEHHAAMGKAIQVVLEKFYNQERWKDPNLRGERLRDWLTSYAKHELQVALNDSTYIDWKKAPSIPEMERICVDGVVGYLSTMKAHRLLGSYAQSEVKVLGFVDEYTPIGGYIDFIIRRKGEDGKEEVLILDGKNSKHKSKYLSPDQLKFYAIAFKLSWDVLPDRLGWIWYRYPHGMVNDDGSVETGLEWIEFDVEDLRSLAADIVEVRKGMENHKFDPTPSPKTCRFCDYEPVCEARRVQREANAAKREAARAKKNAAFRKEVEEKGEEKDGIFHFGF